MPSEDFLRVLSSIKKQTDPSKITIAITGGEPTLRKDLPEIGAKIRLLGFKWGMVTNGMLYTKELHQKLMKSGMGAVTLSLDGMQESHNWLRNSSQSYKRAMGAIDLFYKEDRLNYDIVTCVNQRNISELKGIRNLLEEKDVRAWRLFTIAPIGRAAANKEMLLEPQQLKRLMDFIKESRKSSKIDIKFSCEAYVGSYENEVREGFFFCRAGVNIGSILADGSISACPNINHKYIQGNIYDSDFMDVWGNGFQDMRDRKWTKTNECGQCKDFKFCQGGAMHLRDADGKLLQCHNQEIMSAT
jgi:radical SAM enzyme (rSAM/lipoprotein system)